MLTRGLYDILDVSPTSRRPDKSLLEHNMMHSKLEAQARHCANGSGMAIASVGKLAVPAVSALDMLQERPRHVRLRTGWASLDEGLLGGGLRRAHVSEVCGRSGSGKTQLCMSLVAHTAMDACAQRVAGAEPAVIYVDTSNAFRASCVADLVSEACSSADDGRLNQRRDDASIDRLVQRAMAAIEVHRPRDIWETFNTLQSVSNRLSQLLEQQRAGTGATVTQSTRVDLPVLLVVDSVPRILSPLYASTGSSNPANNGQHHQHQTTMTNSHVWGQGIAVQLGTMLKAMAHAFEMAVMVRGAPTPP